MKYTFTLVFVLILFSCAVQYQNPEIVTVIGIAKDKKARAAVTSIKDGKVYELDEIPYWDEEIRGKLIKVTGTLIVEKLKFDKNDTVLGVPVQQAVGTRRLLLNPKWEIVPNNNESN